MLIEGVFAAVPTPFYPDERIYLRKLEANVARYSRSLMAGMVILGSTGEAPLLNDAESRAVLRAAADAAAAEKVMIAGVGRESVRSTVELTEAAAECGYDAVLVRTPTHYANQMSREAVLHYFRSVADRSPLPVLLYNVPQYVSYVIPVDVVAELAQHPNIIGIKDSSGDVARIVALAEATRSAPTRATTVTPIFEAVTGRMLAAGSVPGDAMVSVGDLAAGLAVASVQSAPALKTRTRDVGFQVLCGSASTLLASIENGASGGILALAACSPQACQDVYMAWKDREFALARQRQHEIVVPNQRIVTELGIAGLKYACDFNGYFGGYPRSPLLPLTVDQKQEIEALLAAIRN